MIGEYVHRNCKLGVFLEEAPGNMRPPYLSGYQDAPYQFKVVEYAPNTCLDRNAGINFNYLPMGSFHKGITQFVNVDGSVHIISDDIDLTVYKGMATVRGERNPSGEGPDEAGLRSDNIASPACCWFWPQRRVATADRRWCP